MSRTINGKSFNQVLKELKAPFDELTKSMEGFDALSIESVEERLDLVLGLNYSFVLLKEPEIINLSREEKPIYFMIGTGIIRLFDDEGVLVCEQTQAGGKRVTYVDKTGNPKDPTNDYQAAISDIKKKCAKNGLGVGRYLSFNDGNSNKQNRSQGKGKKEQPNSNSNENSKIQDNLVVFNVLTNPSIFKDRYVYEVEISVGKNRKRGKAIIWDKVYRKLSHEDLVKIQTLGPGSAFKAEYEEKFYEGENQFRITSLEVG